jgi:pectinesterase
MKKYSIELFFLIGFILIQSSLFATTYDFVVAKDGSGNYKTIKEAVTACRDYAERDYFIFVKRGIYDEKLVIPTWKTRISIIGEDVDSTIICYNDYSGKIDSTGKKLNTFTSFSGLVAGNNITFENITFINSAGRVGQAVAVHVEGDRCVFRNCKLIGNQDTLFAAGENSRQYFVGCYIEGTTDFIFGPATAVFENCTIKSKTNSYVTAASTLPAREFGYVFLNCKLIADSSAKKVFLGRPWRLYAHVAFINCELGGHIVPEGWHNWGKLEAEKTAKYFEYQNTGAGANFNARVDWAKQLTDDEVKKYSVPNILKGVDNWNPSRKSF